MSRATWLSNVRHGRLAVIPALAVLALVATSPHSATAQLSSAATSNQAPIAAFTDTTFLIHNFCGFRVTFTAGAPSPQQEHQSPSTPGVSETATVWSPPAPRHFRAIVPVATTSR